MYKGIQNHYYVYIYHQPTMCDILLLFNFALFFVWNEFNLYSYIHNIVYSIYLPHILINLFYNYIAFDLHFIVF